MNTSTQAAYKPVRVLLKGFDKVPVYQINGITIRADTYSAPWRRRWWLHDLGSHGGKVRESLIRSAGVDPEDCNYWLPIISFDSLAAARAAIAIATHPL